MNLLHTSEHANDRRLNIVLGLSIVVAFGFLIAALLVVPRLLAGASTTEAVAQGNQVTGCRAAYRVEVDDASSKLQTARGRLDVLTSEGLAASVADDGAALLSAIRRSTAAREAVTVAADELEATTRRYSRLVELSRKDPEAFLETCQKEPPR